MKRSTFSLHLQRLIGRAREDEVLGQAACFTSASAASTASPNSPICSPGRIWTASVMAAAAVPVAVGVRCAVMKFRNRGGLS